MITPYELRAWNPEESPGKFLGFLGCSVKKLPVVEAEILLRAELRDLRDSKLEFLAQKMVNHRRNSGANPQEIFDISLTYLRKLREAALHPQPAEELA